jgi:hypothetical protein
MTPTLWGLVVGTHTIVFLLGWFVGHERGWKACDKDHDSRK